MEEEKDARSCEPPQSPEAATETRNGHSASYDRWVLDRIVELMQDVGLDPNDTDTFKHALEDWERWRDCIAEASAKAHAFDKLEKWINGPHPWYSRIDVESAQSVENASVAVLSTQQPPQDSK